MRAFIASSCFFFFPRIPCRRSSTTSTSRIFTICIRSRSSTSDISSSNPCPALSVGSNIVTFTFGTRSTARICRIRSSRRTCSTRSSSAFRVSRSSVSSWMRFRRATRATFTLSLAICGAVSRTAITSFTSRLLKLIRSFASSSRCPSSITPCFFIFRASRAFASRLSVVALIARRRVAAMSTRTSSTLSNFTFSSRRRISVCHR